MSKLCNKCSRYYDDKEEKCPYCDDKGEYNVKNLFLEVENKNYLETNLSELNNINQEIQHDDDSSNIENEKTIIIQKIDEEQIILPKINEEKEIEKTNIEVIEENKNEVIEQNEEKKVKKTVKKKKDSVNFYSYLALILSFILLFITVLSCTTQFDMLTFVHYLITSFLLILTFRLSSKSKNGCYFGVFASFLMILMIIEKDYTNFIVGIYFFFASFASLIKK